MIPKIKPVTLIFVLGGVLLLGSAVLYLGTPKTPLPSIILVDGQIRAEVAELPTARQRGLSGRLFLPPGRGMLFVFEESGFYGFWMKNMFFSIDIVWLSANQTIIDIAPSVSPESFPEVFYPPEPIKYALEIGAGEAERLSLVKGQFLSLEPFR